MNISVVISAYNEEKNIADCLESVKQLVKSDGEIIVINNSSADKTAEIAKKYTDYVLTRENNLMLNINKNYGFSHAKREWILSLDADERITPALIDEIAQSIHHCGDTTHGFLIPRKNIIFNKWIQHGIWWPDYQLRLFRRGKGKFPEKHVHELLEVEGTTSKLQEPMIHHNYISISQYLHKLDVIYTENEVANIMASEKRLHWIDAVRFPVNDFLKTFFLQKGYRDGLHGLVLSMLQAFYMFIVYVKVWEKNGFVEHNDKHFLKDLTKEWKKAKFEVSYWLLSTKISETTSPFIKLYYKVLRKFL